MKVILAGYNVDSVVLAELKKNSPPREDVTPETLSASYARISRDPRPVDELRADARNEVRRARRSNSSIIFKMGHHSVAEHAVFNFDIIGLSRLAIEELEKFRLCSFTEKSQRYNRLEDDYVLPEEIVRAGKEALFRETVRAQNDLYHKVYTRLRAYVFDSHPQLAADGKKVPLLEGWAKEDARYIVSLATEGQLGMTVNARSLEFMIRRFSAKNLAEIRELNRRLHDLAKEVAPSIILFTEGSDFDRQTPVELERVAARHISAGREAADPVSLAAYTPEADTRLAAALLFSSTAASYASCFRKAGEMKDRDREELVETCFKHMEFFDFVQREFEHLDLTYELVLSAAGFAQLKRHRMATLTTQDYDPGLGVVVPPSIRSVGAEDDFLAVIRQTEDAYKEIHEAAGRPAAYVLTNAHRRRILLKVNVRELYHISRLREDSTAQWDIRDAAKKMSDLARRAMPLAGMFLGGKDAYPRAYEKVFGRPPKLSPPPF
jgi:flavin-dependent thymidylate synthase